MDRPSSQAFELLWIESDWTYLLSPKVQTWDERVLSFMHGNLTAQWIVRNMDFQAFLRRQLRSRARELEHGASRDSNGTALENERFQRVEKRGPKEREDWALSSLRVPPSEIFKFIRATAYALGRAWGIEKPLSAGEVINTGKSLLSSLSELESGISKLRSIDGRIYYSEREKDFDYLRRRVSLLMESAGKSSWNQGKNALARNFLTQFVWALRQSGESRPINAMAAIDLVRVADPDVDISIETAQRFLDGGGVARYISGRSW